MHTACNMAFNRWNFRKKYTTTL